LGDDAESFLADESATALSFSNHTHPHRRGKRRSTMRSASIIAAAVLTVGSINFIPATMAAGPTTSPSVINTTTVKGADKAIERASAETSDAKIQHALEYITQCALTPGDMTKLVSHFDEAQRQRIAKSTSYAEDYGSKLDAQINSLNKTWKQKYGNDFSISKTTDVLSSSFASIKTQTASARSVTMESATVDLGTAMGATKLDIPLVCEKDDQWRIMAPASLTAQKLRSNLLAQLTQLNNKSAQWPANETDAYRSVTKHVLMAVLDQQATAPHAQATATPIAKTVQATPVANAQPAAAQTHHWWQFWK
jgi:hypothetical protein